MENIGSEQPHQPNQEYVRLFQRLLSDPAMMKIVLDGLRSTDIAPKKLMLFPPISDNKVPLINLWSHDDGLRFIPDLATGVPYSLDKRDTIKPE